MKLTKEQLCLVGPGRIELALYGEGSRSIWEEAVEYNYPDITAIRNRFAAKVEERAMSEEQLSLPFQRHSDTSREAASSMRNRAQSIRERVYLMLKARPMTDEELSMALGIKGDTIRPRRIELVNLERVYEVGKRRTASGRNASVWGTRD